MSHEYRIALHLADRDEPAIRAILTRHATAATALRQARAEAFLEHVGAGKNATTAWQLTELDTVHERAEADDAEVEYRLLWLLHNARPPSEEV